MKRIFVSLLALALAACANGSITTSIVRVPATVEGTATAGPAQIVGINVTPKFSITGRATVTFQAPVPPYITIDGDYTTDVVQLPGAEPEGGFDPKNVLIRVPNPAAQVHYPGYAGAGSGACAPYGAAATSRPGCTVETVALPRGPQGECLPAVPAAGSCAPAAAPACTNGACVRPQATLNTAWDAGAGACASPKSGLAGIFDQECGKPVYRSPCPGGEAGPGIPTQVLAPSTDYGLKPGQIGWSPIEDCSKPAGVSAGCK